MKNKMMGWYKIYIKKFILNWNKVNENLGHGAVHPLVVLLARV
jgi:hypothetical protein